MNQDFLGYLHVLHHMAVHRLDPWNHDDVKDAFVEMFMYEEHLTDERLNGAVVDFYFAHQQFEKLLDAKKP